MSVNAPATLRLGFGPYSKLGLKPPHDPAGQNAVGEAFPGVSGLPKKENANGFRVFHSSPLFQTGGPKVLAEIRSEILKTHLGGGRSRVTICKIAVGRSDG